MLPSRVTLVKDMIPIKVQLEMMELDVMKAPLMFAHLGGPPVEVSRFRSACRPLAAVKILRVFAAALRSADLHAAFGPAGMTAVAADAALLLVATLATKDGVQRRARAPAQLPSLGLAALLRTLLVLIAVPVVALVPIMPVLVVLAAVQPLMQLLLRASPFYLHPQRHSCLHLPRFRPSTPMGGRSTLYLDLQVFLRSWVWLFLINWGFPPTITIQVSAPSQSRTFATS